MLKNQVFELAQKFSGSSHGSSDYDKDTVFVRGETDREYVPFSYLQKEIPEAKDLNALKAHGFVFSSYDFLEIGEFDHWFQNQFNKRLSSKVMKNIGILHHPDQKSIFDTVEVVHQTFQILKEHHVLMNGKNLPIQLGEWYAKIIFGLHQIKSSSQRGFDFRTEHGSTVEVKVHWHDLTSPKGVKIKKSLAELSDYCIIMYISKNFTIRDILFLDSEFVLRKFDTKGHTIFLKDQDVASYFFSRSDKHFDKVANKTALLRFASPNFAMKLEDRLK